MRRYKIGDAELDPVEQKIVANVETYGWHIAGVMAADEAPEFAYSIGIYQSYSHPEFAVFGIPFDYTPAILNDFVQAIKGGERFETGREYADLLEGARCTFVPVDHGWYEDYFGRGIDFYGTLEFPVLQCIWSDPEGRFPWDPDFQPDLVGLQPNLMIAPDEKDLGTNA